MTEMSNELVLIRWRDAYGCSPEWRPVDSVKAHPLFAESVGWIIEDNADSVVVLPHRTKGNENCDAQGCGDMTIPKAAITEIIKLDRLDRRVEAPGDVVRLP